MVTSLALGWRLAVRSTGHGRWRASMLVLVTALGAALVLTTFVLARAAQLSSSQALAPQQNQTEISLAVTAVLLPVLVLVASVARLSSSLRAIRLARLSLLGMTRGDITLVGVGEILPLAVAGWALGVTATYAVRPLLAQVQLSTRHVSVADVTPTTAELLWCALVIPVLVLVIGAVPARGGGRRDLAMSRRAATARVGWWRILPLVVGVAALVTGPDRTSGGMDSVQYSLAPGLVLLGVGLVLVLPAVARLTADLLLRLRGPVSTITGRRLQGQPSATSRAYAALLLGLFVATGARAVMVVAENTPQYRAVAYQAHVEGFTELNPSEGGETAGQLAARARTYAFVRDAVVLRRVLLIDEGDPLGDVYIGDVYIGTCVDLARVETLLSACHDDQPQWLDRPAVGYSPQIAAEFDVPDSNLLRVTKELVPLPSALPVTTTQRGQAGLSQAYRLFVPLAMLDIDMSNVGDEVVVVRTEPTKDLAGALWAVGLDPSSGWDVQEYEEVLRFTNAIRIMTFLVLGLGLLALGIGALDRAIERRGEVIRLQLLGVPGRTLLAAHLLEVAVPLLIGSALAVGLGWLMGDSYLGMLSGDPYLDDTRLRLPPEFMIPVVAAAALGSLMVAAVTSIAANPRIRPSLIRSA